MIKLINKIICLFKDKPLIEIRHDIEIIMSFYERANPLFNINLGQEEYIKTADKIGNLLELAEKECDFAQAWTYVNLADAHLPLIVREEELEAVMARLCVADRKLSEEIQTNKVNLILNLEKSKSGDSTEKNDSIKEKQTPPTKEPTALTISSTELTNGEKTNDDCVIKKIMERIGESLKKDEEDDTTDNNNGEKKKKNKYKGSLKHRNDLFMVQLIRAHQWNAQNRRISLKLKLWGSIGYWALLSFIFAVLVGVWFNNPILESKVGGPIALKLIGISFLGFFGGVLSSYFNLDKRLIESPSYRLIKRNILLRMLFGGAGAFVVFLTVCWLSPADILPLLNYNIYFFLVFGVAGGFSEKLFAKALDKVTDNITLSAISKDDNKKEDTKENEKE